MVVSSIINVCVIIPCYRSAAYLKETVGELKAILFGDRIETGTAAGRADMRAGEDSRIILINDGSPDDTWDVIVSLCSSDQHIIGINLAANVGQANARLAAIPFICGDYAVFMDDDGQHPANQIFPMIAKLNEGWHMVYAQFPEMKETAWRRFFSSLNNIYVSLLLHKPLGLHITSFFVLDGSGIRILKNAPYASLIGAAVLRETRRVTGFRVNHQLRRSGSGNYTLKRLLKHWRDITRSILFSKRPLQSAPVISEILNLPTGLKAIVKGEKHLEDLSTGR